MDAIIEKLKADYDAVAYGSYVHLHAHPERIAVIAALRGLPFAPVNDCRVLEIGSASGSNLIPMAEQLPGSRFIGIELSERQTGVGAALIRQLGLTNIELRCQDLMDLPEEIGVFDFIIAHGVYSWVPEPVRQGLMRLCQKHLSPRGLAYISYNTYPGWRLKEVAREMMLYHARTQTGQTEKAARGREIVKFISENSQDAGFYKMLISHHAKTVGESTDPYLLHDHMEAVNDPRYFWQFIEEARASGLDYVGEAAIETSPWAAIPPHVRDAVWKMCADEIEREQYLDFLVNPSFRRSVLCRAGSAAAPGVMASRVERLFVAGNPPEVSAGKNAQGQEIFQFGGGPHKVHLSDPRPIAVLRHLRRMWPSAVPFSELVSLAIAQSPPRTDRARIVEALVPAIEALFSLGIIEFWTHPTDIIAAAAGQYPRVTRFARWQAANNLPVASLRHAAIKPDDVMRMLIPLLDGSRDRKALVAELGRLNTASPGTGGDKIMASQDPEQLEQRLETMLQLMASMSLLVA